MPEARAKTEDEARAEFLGVIRQLVLYWATHGVGGTRERLNGLAFSILNIFDGTSSGLPAIDLVLRPHPNDEAFCRDEGENWYQNGQVINSNVMLHDEWMSDQEPTAAQKEREP